MAEYGVIYNKIWDNPRFNEMSDDAKIFLFYCFANRHISMTGLYTLKKLYIRADIKSSGKAWDEGRLDSAMKEVINNDWIKYEEETSLVLVYGWFEGDPPPHKIMNPNQVKRALAQITELPRSLLVLDAIVDINKAQKLIKVKDDKDERFKERLEELLEQLAKRLPESLPKPLLKRLPKRFQNPDSNKLKKPVNTEHRDIIKYYTDAYKKKFAGEEYDFKGTKDGPNISRLLKRFGFEKLKLLIDQLFISQDEFIKETDRSIGVLSSCSNKLAQEINKKKKNYGQSGEVNF